MYPKFKNFGRLLDPRDAFTHSGGRETSRKAISRNGDDVYMQQVPGCFEYRIFGSPCYVTVKPSSSRNRRPPGPTSSWSTARTPPGRQQWRRRRMPSRKRTSPRSCLGRAPHRPEYLRGVLGVLRAGCPRAGCPRYRQVALKSGKEGRISICQALKARSRG